MGLGKGLWVVLGLLLLGAFLVAVFRYLRRLRDETLAEVRAQLGSEEPRLLDPSANCFGVESAGMFQGRGNGCLALTGERLVFRMWVPREQLEVPVTSLTGVETARSFLGKTKGRDLLVIRFREADGTPNALGLLVRDLAAWQQVLGALVAGDGLAPQVRGARAGSSVRAAPSRPW